MRWFSGMTLTAVLAAAAGEAHACRIPAELKPEDVRRAEVVVVGRITRYEIVLDRKARQARREMLARSPKMSPEHRRGLEDQTAFLSDYARFAVRVEAVLVGKTPRIVTATWDNSTFEEPKTMPAGRYLVALRPGDGSRPDRQAGRWTVLQAPCAPAFIFRDGSAEARAVRDALRAR